MFRTDAGRGIGSGHLMRCLALAQAWQEGGGRAVFAIQQRSPAIEARLREECMPVAEVEAPAGSAEDVALTVEIARRSGTEWVVLDGYHFDSRYLDGLKGRGMRVLLIDDLGRSGCERADLVLNQNIDAAVERYPGVRPDRLLMGPRYALLRREFTAFRLWERHHPQVARRVLVTLGGSDPENLSALVAQWLDGVRIRELEVVVVAGPMNENSNNLEQVARGVSYALRIDRDVRCMAEKMAWADIAVSAGGTTCWELAFMGLPNLIIVLAENQEANAAGLAAHGVSVNLGWHNVLNSRYLADVVEEVALNRHRRQEMSVRGRSLVDGCGAVRVVSVLEEELVR